MSKERTIEEWVQQFRLEILQDVRRPKHDPRWITERKRFKRRR